MSRLRSKPSRATPGVALRGLEMADASVMPRSLQVRVRKTRVVMSGVAAQEEMAKRRTRCRSSVGRVVRSAELAWRFMLLVRIEEGMRGSRGVAVGAMVIWGEAEDDKSQRDS